MDVIDNTLDWIDLEMEADDCLMKRKEVENLANPILRMMYSGGGSDDGDFGDDEL